MNYLRWMLNIILSFLIVLGVSEKSFASAVVCSDIFKLNPHSIEELEKTFLNLAETQVQITERAQKGSFEEQAIAKLSAELNKLEELVKKKYPEKVESFSRSRYKSLIQEIYNKRAVERGKKQAKERINSEKRRKEFEEQKRIFNEQKFYQDGDFLDSIDKAIGSDDPILIRKLLQENELDIRFKNISGFSILEQAVNYNSIQVIDMVLSDPLFKSELKNKYGLNAIEFALALNKSKVAKYLKSKLPNLKYREIKVQERTNKVTEEYPEGEPFLGFVKINPGTFRMGDDSKVEVTLTKAYEFMSTDTTQKQWRDVVWLARKNLQRKITLEADPSKFIGDNRPVEQVSLDMTVEWLKLATELSDLNIQEVQNQLKEIFPGHYKGAVYQLPTSAQWEFVGRLGGLANGLYSHANTDQNIGNYTWHKENSKSETHLVGLKKPNLIPQEEGKFLPIYDVFGNVWKRVLDTYSNELVGGVDPVNTARFSNASDLGLFRGGSWFSVAEDLRLGLRSRGDNNSSSAGLGFRPIRVSP